MELGQLNKTNKTITSLVFLKMQVVSPMLDHRELETLVAIMDGQSFDAAAQALHVSPGAISQRVKSLENRLGQSVLIRSNPPRLTAVGEQVLGYARRVLLLQAEMEQELQYEQEKISHTLSLAVNHDSLSCWFMEAVQGLAQWSNLQFDIRASDTVSTQQLLKSGEVIAAVTSQAKLFPGCKNALSW